MWINFGFVVLVAVFFGLIATPKVPSWVPGSGFFSSFYPHLGLDLQGGTHLVYQADTSKLSGTEKSDAVEGVRDVIERRINAYGVAEPVIQTTRQGDNYRVIVELAGVTDVNEAIKLIGETPLLEFKETSGDSAQPTTEDANSIKTYNDVQLKLAESVLKQVIGGGDFNALAKQYSADNSNSQSGGILDFVKKGVYVPEFDAVLFDQLKDGETSQKLVTTPFGYHIVRRLESKTDSEGNLLVKAQHILFAVKTFDANNNINWVNTELSGKQLTRAQVIFDQQSTYPEVSLVFNSEGAMLFEQITERNLNKQVGIFLDGELISAPTVQTKISGGEAVITGNFNVDEAKLLARRLNAGALPVAIQLISQQTVGATLGKISLQQSLIAGLFGLLMVALFMIFYYRLPGLISVVALCVYALISMGIFEIIPVTLTLSGIAGFILSVGMAVDANVLIFERIKEELREGEPLTIAIERGFKRAWLSIRDSNVSSLITTFILFWFGSSIIKGFALTLGIGIMVSMFSAILVSHNLLQLVCRIPWLNNSWLYGVKTKAAEEK